MKNEVTEINLSAGEAELEGTVLADNMKRTRRRWGVASTVCLT